MDKNGVQHDCNNPSTCGYLNKRSQWLHEWRRRFFILKGSKLFFSSSEFGTPHGMIDLSTCMTVKSAELKAGKKNAIEVSTTETTYYMFADNEQEKDEWSCWASVAPGRRGIDHVKVKVSSILYLHTRTKIGVNLRAQLDL